MTTKTMNAVAAVFWGLAAWFRLRLAWQVHDLTIFLLGFQSLLVFWAYTRRKDAEAESSVSTQCLALGIAFLPWLLHTDTTSWMLRYWPGILLSLAGLALSIWAVWALGASFSIAPAVRGLVRRGPYGWMRHPMYTGELLTLIGVLASVHSRFYWLQNSALVLLMAGGVVWRIGLEEKLLQKYAAYAAYRQSVPWRMLPGVW